MDSSTHRAALIGPQADRLGRFFFRVGDVTVGVRMDTAEFSFAGDGNLARFLSAGPRCDLEIEVSWTQQIARATGEPVFDSGGLWKLYRSNDISRFEFISEPLGAAPYKLCTVDRAFSRAHVQMNRLFLNDCHLPNPLEYPLDELLVMHRLAVSGGVELHACGLIGQNGHGRLFAGHSGAGKSTTAALWAEHGVTILSDDRIILRQRDGEIWMYGTPWHGDGCYAEPQMARVSAIYLLEHGLENSLRKLAPNRAGAELFARSFVPFYDWEMLDRTLSFLEQVVQRVPCAWYRFTPDNDAVEFVLNGEL